MSSALPRTATVLDSSAPILSERYIETLLGDVYGVHGTITPLTSERDRNYHVHARDGRHFLLKVTNSAEPEEITRFQTDALLQIEKADPSLPVPRVIPTLSGQSLHRAALPDQDACVARLLTFLQGEQLYKTERTPTQRRNIGTCLARLDKALLNAAPPSIAHVLQWDASNAPALRGMMEAIEDQLQHARIAQVLEAFESRVAPILPQLRRQVIHNDFNPHNILVAPDDHARVTGILDFGDLVHTPLVVDLATACAYQVLPGPAPLHSVGEFVAAYHAVIPLEPAELSILLDLIRARLITTIVITNWRARRYPANRTYILRNTGPSWLAFDQLQHVGPAEAEDYFLSICNPR
jgi:Ser/Thr protein kinase RdoA (MazF antagonist)